MYLQDKGSPDAASLPNDSENPPQYEKVPLMPEVGVVKDVAEFWISDDEDLESNIDPGKLAGKFCLRKAPRWSCLYLAIGTLLPLCFLGLAYNGLATVLDLSQDKSKFYPEGQGRVFSAREIVVDKKSEPIVGTYPLFDLLSLSTTSGSIDVTVIPQRANTESPGQPARFRIRTNSGSIAVSFSFPGATSSPKINSNEKLCLEQECWNRYPPFQFRPYELDVETISGSISGQFFFSTLARLSSESGGISVRLLPIVRLINLWDVDGGEDENSIQNNALMTTWTGSGSQDVRLMDPCFVDFPANTTGAKSWVWGKPALVHHETHEGTLNINYPQAWTGNAHARAESGNIAFDGRGLEIIRNGDGSVDGFKCEGQKEWGNMNVFLGSEAGAIIFHVG